LKYHYRFVGRLCPKSAKYTIRSANARNGFAQKVAKYTIRSANGAEYESQGQVRSKAEHVAPGKNNQKFPALKGRNCLGNFGPSGLDTVCSW
jgi:hypothetical protein